MRTLSSIDTNHPLQPIDERNTENDGTITQHVKYLIHHSIIIGILINVTRDPMYIIKLIGQQ